MYQYKELLKVGASLGTESDRHTRVFQAEPAGSDKGLRLTQVTIVLMPDEAEAPGIGQMVWEL